MDVDTQATPVEGGSREETIRHTGIITPELVNEIADKVYAMLCLELRIEKERLQPWAKRPLRLGGGWY